LPGAGMPFWFAISLPPASWVAEEGIASLLGPGGISTTKQLREGDARGTLLFSKGGKGGKRRDKRKELKKFHTPPRVRMGYKSKQGKRGGNSTITKKKHRIIQYLE